MRARAYFGEYILADICQTVLPGLARLADICQALLPGLARLA